MKDKSLVIYKIGPIAMSGILGKIPEGFELTAYQIRHCEPDGAFTGFSFQRLSSIDELRTIMANLPKFSYVSHLMGVLHGKGTELTDDGSDVRWLK